MITHACKVTKEVETGDILDVVKLYNAFRDPKSKEANRDYIFRITYPSSALRQLIEAVFSKLSGKQPKGVFVTAGGYGSGKSHALLVLYHVVKAGLESSNWMNQWNITASFPPTTKVVAVHLIGESAPSLWEPLFERSGQMEIIKKIKEWPSTEQWGELAKDGPILVILDELEDWLGGLNEDKRKVNRNALHALLEAATEKKYPLAVVLAIYGRDPKLLEPIYRVNPAIWDFATIGDREQIIMHRLIEEL